MMRFNSFLLFCCTLLFLLSCSNESKNDQCNPKLDFTLNGKDYVSSCEIFGSEPTEELTEVVQSLLVAETIKIKLLNSNNNPTSILLNGIKTKEINTNQTSFTINKEGYYKLTLSNENGDLSKWISVRPNLKPRKVSKSIEEPEITQAEREPKQTTSVINDISTTTIPVTTSSNSTNLTSSNSSSSGVTIAPETETPSITPKEETLLKDDPTINYKLRQARAELSKKQLFQNDNTLKKNYDYIYNYIQKGASVENRSVMIKDLDSLIVGIKRYEVVVEDKDTPNKVVEQVQPKVSADAPLVPLRKYGEVYNGSVTACSMLSNNWKSGPFMANINPTQDIQIRSCNVVSQSNWTAKITLNDSNGNIIGEATEERIVKGNTEINLTQLNRRLKKGTNYTLTIEGNGQLSDIKTCDLSGTSNKQVSIKQNNYFFNFNYKY